MDIEAGFSNSVLLYRWSPREFGCLGAVGCNGATDIYGEEYVIDAIAEVVVAVETYSCGLVVAPGHEIESVFTLRATLLKPYNRVKCCR